LTLIFKEVVLNLWLIRVRGKGDEKIRLAKLLYQSHSILISLFYISRTSSEEAG
jgi:hypothetical protein